MPEQNQFKMKLSQVTSPGSSNPSIPPTTDYCNVHEAADDSLSLALIIARAADERKAANIEILKVGEVSYLTNYFIIMTGFSKVQLRGISNAIQDQVYESLARHPLRVEGLSDANWVLHDYGDAIAHIFMPQEREFYNLEAFWGHAERIQYY